MRSGFLFGKMKMETIIEIKNLTRRKINAPLIKKAAAFVMEGEKKSRGELSLVFVGQNRIRALNKKHRGVDRATDVLSFALCDKFSGNDNKILLGEVVTCPQIIAKDAKQADCSFDYQAVWAVIHGILHLLGYDHEERGERERKMRQREKKYLKQILISKS